MLVNKIKQWIYNDEDWFTDFLTEMTKDGKYGDNLNGEYPDIEIDDDEIELIYYKYDRCGDSEQYYALIPIEHVVKKLRKDKLELLKN